MITCLSWGLSAISLIGVVLNIRKNKWCFPIWAITNISWAFVDLSFGLYSQSFLFFIYFGLAIWGIIEWGKHEK